jgi:hypothetical protein
MADGDRNAELANANKSLRLKAPRFDLRRQPNEAAYLRSRQIDMSTCLPIDGSIDLNAGARRPRFATPASFAPVGGAGPGSLRPDDVLVGHRGHLTRSKGLFSRSGRSSLSPGAFASAGALRGGEPALPLGEKYRKARTK